MTITVDTANITVATPQTNASSPQTFSHTCGANIDALVVVVTIYDTSSSDGVVSGVKYNGVSFDSPAATLYYDALCDGHCSIWLLPNPITGDSYTVEVSFGGTVTDLEAAAIGIEGTVGTFDKDSNGTPNTGTTGNLTIAWDTVETNTIVFSCSLDDQGDAGKVHPQSTEIYNVDVTDIVSAQYEIRTQSGSQTQTIVDDDGDEDWVIVGAAFKETAGAVEYQQSTGGVLTPVGIIIKNGRKVLSGVSTFTGSISKSTTKTFIGSSTWAGTLIKQAQKIFTGASTFAGSLVASYQKLISLTGSLTPSGTLIKSTAKAIVGSVTVAGSLVKETVKSFTGSVTLSGVLSTTKVTLLAIGGAITASGSLIKQTNKIFVGSITTVGTLVKQTSKVFTGGVTLVGALVKQTAKIFIGSMTTVGEIVRHTAKSFIGSITAIGSLATQKSGVGGQQYYQVVGGVITMSGDIIRQIGRNISGALTAVGTLVRLSSGTPTPARRIYSIATENRIYSISRGVRP